MTTKLKLKGKVSIGPTQANCHDCRWKESSPGGQRGRDRVIFEAQYHRIHLGHQVGVNTTRAIVYERG